MKPAKARTIAFTLCILLLILLMNCGSAETDSFSSENVMSEKSAKEELLSVALILCLQSGGSPEKFLETYIFIDKQFTKSSGTQSQRDRITYRKTDVEKCRNNILVFPVEKCDFKPFDLWNYLADKSLCKLDPISYTQY